MILYGKRCKKARVRDGWRDIEGRPYRDVTKPYSRREVAYVLAWETANGRATPPGYEVEAMHIAPVPTAKHAERHGVVPHKQFKDYAELEWLDTQADVDYTTAKIREAFGYRGCLHEEAAPKSPSGVVYKIRRKEVVKYATEICA
jgi:hypothetical protein